MNSSTSNSNNKTTADMQFFENAAHLYPALPVGQRRYIRPARLAILIVSILFIFASVNFSARAYLSIDPLNLGQVIVSEKWNLVYNLEGPVDYLLLGDSTGNQGFDPAIVEDELGLYGVNLATLGNFGLVDDLWFLQAYMEQYGAPPMVIVIHSFDVPQREPDINNLLGSYAIPYSVIENQIKPSSFGEVLNLAQIYQSRFFPLYYRQETLRRVIIRLLEGRFQILEPDYTFNKYGFMTLTDYGEFVVEDDMFVFRRQLKAGELYGGFSPSNQDAMNQMIALADEYDFPIYFLNSPIYSDLRYSQGYKNVMEELVAGYEAFAAQSDNVRYFPDVFRFPPNMMENLDHVLDTAAPEYTRQIMELVWGS